MTYLLDVSLRYRFFTVVTTAVVIALGLLSFRGLTIDAVPDLTPVQVQILTRAPALGPVEVEQFITFPIETSLNGLPALLGMAIVSRR
jgi:cobalt-zinc-cadmium resistance protein CzcA